VPEVLEVEYFRRVADRAVGRTIARVRAPDEWFVKRTDPAALGVLVGCRVTGTRRRGKLLMIDTDGPVLGLRFGMTGRLLVDGFAPIERLEYASARYEPEWFRFGLDFAEGGRLDLVDPRRLGGVELDPDPDRLGPDVMTIGAAGLRDVLAGSTAPLKARLLDQDRLAGLGNLLVDEILWRAGLDPARPAGGLDPSELARLHRHLRATLARLLEKGGSNKGDLQGQRRRDGECPRCGTPLERRTIGGRTTFSCPTHQR